MTSYPSNKFYITYFTRLKGLKDILKTRSIQPFGVQKENFTLENPDKVWSFDSIYNAAKAIGNLDKYLKSVAYTIMFPDKKGNIIFEENKLNNDFVYVVFSPKIIEDNATMKGQRDVSELPIFCDGLKYGKYNSEKCSYYDTKKSLKENLNSWRELIMKKIDTYEINPQEYKLISLETKTLETELLIEGEMPIDMDLIAIYIPKTKYEIIDYPESYYKQHPYMREVAKKMKNLYKEEEEKIQEIIDKYPELPWTRENPFK
jgi:hypothetical protein